MKSKDLLHRRTVLRGLGTAISLPLLEAMVPSRGYAQNQVPYRVAFVYWPIGAYPDNGNGAPLHLTQRIPNEIKPFMSTLSNLANPAAAAQAATSGGAGGHGNGFVTYFRGAVAQPRSGNALYTMTETWDQAMAKLSGFRQSPFPSLTSNMVWRNGEADTKYAPQYGQTMSWQSDGNPSKAYSDPKELYDRLFSNYKPVEVDQRNLEQLTKRINILDYVLNDIKGLKRNLGQEDQQRLDRYLSSVEALDQKVTSSMNPGGGGSGASPGASCSPTAKLPKNGSSDYPPNRKWGENLEDALYPTRLGIMQDIMVKSFECDLTRMFTFMHGGAAIYTNQSWVSTKKTNSWHRASHYTGEGDRNDYMAITSWHFDQIMSLLLKLNSIPDPFVSGSTLLKSMLVMMGSSMADGGKHIIDQQLTMFMAGTGGNRFKPGFNRSFTDGTRVSDVWYTILKQGGYASNQFGDSRKILTDLLA